MKKKEEEQRVTFRRIRGRIVPIVVGGGAAAAAFEASRRSTIKKSGDLKVVKRRAIFSNAISLRAKRRGVTTAFAKFRPVRRRLFVDTIFGVDAKSNVAILSQLSKQAKEKGLKSITGNLASTKIVDLIAKRGGTFVNQSLSRTGRVGKAAAKAEITRLIRGKGRGIIIPLLRIK